jgi:hypothetical protein
VARRPDERRVAADVLPFEGVDLAHGVEGYFAGLADGGSLRQVEVHGEHVVQVFREEGGPDRAAKQYAHRKDGQGDSRGAVPVSDAPLDQGFVHPGKPRAGWPWDPSKPLCPLSM